MDENKLRYESDSMGKVELPEDAYWGAQAQRASENFNVSSLRIPIPLLKALARVKQSAAVANSQLGLLDKKLADGITAAAGEVMAEAYQPGKIRIEMERLRRIARTHVHQVRPRVRTGEQDRLPGGVGKVTRILRMPPERSVGLGQ